MAEQDSTLTSAARAIGKTAGKVASALGMHGAAQGETVPSDLYRAEYLGSGTFIIRKPKRKKAKRHQTLVKSRVRGARK